MRKYTTEQIDKIIKFIKESTSYHEVIVKLGSSGGGAVYSQLRYIIKKHNIDISHFKNNRKKYSEDIKYRISGKALRTKLLKEGILYKCNKCGQDENWNNCFITLEVNHIDKNRYNNDINNLEFLCPNCHNAKHHIKDKYCKCGKKISVISKYCHKCAAEKTIYKRKKFCPSKEELEILVKTIPMTKIALQFNVTDKTIRKWCVQYGLITKGRGNWTPKKAFIV